MRRDDDLRDQRLYQEIARITNDYGALNRRTVRELARSRAELAAARTALGTVAHDLRTPLSAALGFTEMLLDDEELTPAQQELGERVHRAARTMSTLVEELVEVVTAGSASLTLVPVDVSALVAQTVTRHQLLRPPRGVRLALNQDVDGDAPTVVLGDEVQLERLLDNLISNAVKFSPDNARVRLSLIDSRSHAEIRVCDEGPGIAAEHHELIFQPFHREPDAQALPGLGLGLAIVKQLAERHGGRVHVESVLGAGATFVVRLPLAGRSRTEGEAQNHAPSAGLEGMGTVAGGSS